MDLLKPLIAPPAIVATIGRAAGHVRRADEAVAGARDGAPT
jgi:hypothetical protein